MLIWSYVWPTVWDVWNSFRHVSYFRVGSDLGVGFANYDAAFRGGFRGSVGFALTLAAVPLLVVVVAAPALAWAAHQMGTAGTFGLGCAVAVTAYLAALRRRDPRRQVWPALLVEHHLPTSTDLGYGQRRF
jgi:ABC-type sugar transport system permease subunit